MLASVHFVKKLREPLPTAYHCLPILRMAYSFLQFGMPGLSLYLQRDMTSDSFIEVVQEAVDRTGMNQVPLTDRPHQTAERQRPGLRLKSLEGLPGDGRHQAHPGDALPPSDQQQAGALSPDAEAGREPGPL